MSNGEVSGFVGLWVCRRLTPVDGLVEAAVKGRVVLVALEAQLGHAHGAVAKRLVDARLHRQSRQRLHPARANLEDGVAGEGGV